MPPFSVIADDQMEGGGRHEIASNLFAPTW